MFSIIEQKREIKIKMKKIFLYLVFIFLLFSCNNKNVKIPVNNIKGIQDTIYNNSKIWIFFQQKNEDTIAFLNRNNKLANTHFIYNIDKRLKLKHFKNVLNNIQLKKEQPSMHSNGKYMHSYLSYVDTSANKLSMVLFDSVKFSPLKELINTKKQILLKYSTDRLNLNGKNIAFDVLLEELYTYKDSSNRKLNLILNENISYNRYLNLKAILQQLKLDSVSINKHEYLD